MRSAFVIVASVLLLFSLSVSFAQDTTTPPTSPADTTSTTPPAAPAPDPCAGVTCNPSEAKCADGFLASCQNSCSNGACSKCEPSCAGHETPAQPSPAPACPAPPPEKPACPPPSYMKEKRDSNNCLVGFDCVPSSTAPIECPSISSPSPDFCIGGTVNKKFDANNCVVGYDCVSAGTCPSPPVPPQCENPREKRDSNGCVVSYDCSQACAQVITPAADAAGNCREFSNSCLPPGWKRVDGCDRFIRPACGDGKCDIGEDINNCHDDCGPYDYRRNQPRDYRSDFPTSTEMTCPDGTKVPCGQTSSGERYCEQCPMSVPEGCRQEKDNSGFVRVICNVERKCPEIPQDVRLKCVDQQGIPIFKKDPNGCESFFCQFGNEVSSPFTGYQQCPDGKQIDEEMKKCSSLGLRGIIAFEGGCKIARCVEEKKPVENCGMIPGPEREKIENSCREKGLGTVSRFEGCRQVIECGQMTEGQQSCAKDMPAEAYQKCSQQGGELVVQRSDDGCIRFSKCIQRGDVTDTYVEKPTGVPDSTELLSLAFKLESLNIDLDRLAKKTNDIAEYYKSSGSTDEARFRRVSSMFTTAKDKVNEIKEKIRSRLETMTEDDVVEIKRDIKYLKDVMIKDILYVMLSSSSDVQQLTTRTPAGEDGANCGEDGSCFDRAFRLCKPITFSPDADTIVEITGLADDVCVLKAKLREGKGPPAGLVPGINPPYDMTCKIKDYALGMKGPEDIIPYCEGSMIELMKKFGTGPGSQRPSQPAQPVMETAASTQQAVQQPVPQNYAPQRRIRPDQCEFTDMTDEECVKYMLDVKGQPPECKGLTEEQCRKFLVRSWKNQRQSQQFAYPGSQPAGNKMGNAYCGDTICDDFEQQNPSGCPQDCGPLLRGSASGGGTYNP